jgi:hypothetical protein
METLNRYAALAFLLFAVAGLPTTLSRWREASRCYGRACFPVARNLWTYALRSAHRVHLLGTLALLGLAALGELRWLVKNEPYPRWLYAAALFWSFRLVADRICPPTAFFIASSSRRIVEARGWLSFGLRRHRLLSFLGPREHVDPVAFQAFFRDDLRVRRGSGWRTPVYHLTDVAPVVIADIRDFSPAIQEEVTRLAGNGLWSKIRFLSGGAPPAWLASLCGSMGLEPACISHEDVGGILDRQPLSAHELAHRQSLQDEYASLFREIPSAARPDLSLREAQITALAILDREYRRFLSMHKGTDLSDLGGLLVEDVPGVASREEEDAYLRSNRGLQIADGILKGIHEELETRSGAWAVFHGASLDVKIGKLNRFRRQWEPALHHLHRAQQVLRGMQAACGGEVDPGIIAGELGDALFLEGEVWTVQHLDAPTQEKRSRGLACFREALDLDRSLGRDDPAAALRIQRLGESTGSSSRGSGS